MQRAELVDFLQPSHVVLSLAEQFTTALFAPGADSLSRHVVYSSTETANNVRASALGIELDIRFSYVKLLAVDMEFLTGQYSFYRKAGEQEEKLQTVIRLVPPREIVLPSGDVVSIDQGGLDSAEQLQVRNAVTKALLAELVGKIDTWSHDN